MCVKFTSGVECKIRRVEAATAAEKTTGTILVGFSELDVLWWDPLSFLAVFTSTVNHLIKIFVVTTITTKQQLVIRIYRQQYRSAFFIGKTIVKIDFIIFTSLPVCFVCWVERLHFSFSCLFNQNSHFSLRLQRTHNTHWIWTISTNLLRIQRLTTLNQLIRYCSTIFVITFTLHNSIFTVISTVCFCHSQHTQLNLSTQHY